MGVSSEFVRRHRHTHASISCFALCVDLAYPCNYDWSFLEGTYKKHRFPLLRFAQADYPSSSQEQVLSRVGWYCELKLTWTRMVLQLSNSKGTKHCWSLANADCNTCAIKVENQWVNRHNFESIMSIMFHTMSFVFLWWFHLDSCNPLRNKRQQKPGIVCLSKSTAMSQQGNMYTHILQESI